MGSEMCIRDRLLSEGGVGSICVSTVRSGLLCRLLPYRKVRTAVPGMYALNYTSQNTHRPSFAVDDHGEMRVDAQSWAAAAIETKSDEKEISRTIKVCRMKNIVRFLPRGLLKQRQQRKHAAVLKKR